MLEVQGDKAVVNFMSSEEQLFNEQRDIMLRTSDTEFGTTGLTKNTFVINQDYARIRVSVDRLFELKSKPVGYVSGYFKKRIEDYTGYAF